MPLFLSILLSQDFLLMSALKPVIADKAKENQVSSGENFGKGCLKSDKAIEKIDTNKELAKQAGVSFTDHSHLISKSTNVCQVCSGALLISYRCFVLS